MGDTRTASGDLLPWERPRPELEEFGDGWVGCSTCQVQWNVPALTPGLDMYLTWREHLYEHIRGVRP